MFFTVQQVSDGMIGIFLSFLGIWDQQYSSQTMCPLVMTATIGTIITLGPGSFHSLHVYKLSFVIFSFKFFCLIVQMQFLELCQEYKMLAV